LLWLVLATFAVGPQWVFADSASPALLAWAMPAQMLLLLLLGPCWRTPSAAACGWRW
jgi:hypothetical protein